MGLPEAQDQSQRRGRDDRGEQQLQAGRKRLRAGDPRQPRVVTLRYALGGIKSLHLSHLRPAAIQEHSNKQSPAIPKCLAWSYHYSVRKAFLKHMKINVEPCPPVAPQPDLLAMSRSRARRRRGRTSAWPADLSEPHCPCLLLPVLFFSFPSPSSPSCPRLLLRPTPLLPVLAFSCLLRQPLQASTGEPTPAPT